ncbi:MAG: glucosaminidase domain-containing protein [Bacteroidetes bacterium]|nr:glucosaminidase domain-containing protein [Bacteroidota bacterium]
MASYTYQSSKSTNKGRTINGKSFISKNWFECLILLGLFYLLLCRDVHLTIGYKAPGQSAQTHDIQISENLSSLGILTGHSYATTTSSALDVLRNSVVPASLNKEDLDRLQQCQAFIERFVRLAIAEKEKFGIPASITLAQSMLSSKAGESGLAVEANNFFGQLCANGQSCYKLAGKSFANFDTPWESFREHSKLLRSDDFQSLYRHRADDYEAWAYGLVQTGYYPDESYARKLIQIIESLDLYLFDKKF